jgi:hypothetical protein
MTEFHMTSDLTRSDQLDLLIESQLLVARILLVVNLKSNREAVTQVQDDLASISGRYLEQLRRRGQVQPVHDGEDGLGDVVGDRVSDTGVDDGRDLSGRVDGIVHEETPYVARVGARYVADAIHSLSRRWLQRKGRVRQSPSADAGLSDRRGRAAVGAAALLVAAGVLVVPAPASDAAAVYRQIACAPGGEVVSQNFGSPTGGASRIDGPLGGTGWQCRTYTTSFTGYMRLASRRVGVPLKCEVWRGDLRMVWDERPTAVGCYVLPSQGSRS